MTHRRVAPFFRLTAVAALMGGVALAQEPADEPVGEGVEVIGETEQEEALQAEGVAAVVNDEVITTYDVRQRMRLVLVGLGIQPTEQVLAQIQAQALRSLIDERLQVQEASSFEIEITPDEVAASLRRSARQNNVTVDELERQLASTGIGLKTLEDQLRAQLAWQQLVGGRYGSRVRISDDQISTALDRMIASAARPQYLVSEILLEASDQTEAETAYRTALSLIDQMRQGASFPNVARQFSNSPSASVGGDIGWVMSGELAPELERVLDQLDPGQVSTPVATPSGFYILALRDKTGGTDDIGVLMELKQLLAPVTDEDEAEVREIANYLDSMRSSISSCEDVDNMADEMDGVIASDLGGVRTSDLSPDFQDALVDMEPGDVSEPLRTPAGVHLIAVCSRELVGGDDDLIPTRDEVEDRLYDQQLAMLARRYLRDLRRDSLVETR